MFFILLINTPILFWASFGKCEYEDIYNYRVNWFLFFALLRRIKKDSCCVSHYNAWFSVCVSTNKLSSYLSFNCTEICTLSEKILNKNRPVISLAHILTMRMFKTIISTFWALGLFPCIVICWVMTTITFNSAIDSINS